MDRAHVLASLLASAALLPAAAAQTTLRASELPGGGDADGASQAPALSADGRFAAFESLATNLVPGDTNNCCDIFVRDLATGAIVRASVDSQGAQARGDSHRPSLSADGRYVAFESLAPNLVANDTNGVCDVFVRDLVAGTTLRASLDAAGLEASAESRAPSLSADGRFLAFASFARLVAADADLSSDIYVRDLWSGQLVFASPGTGAPYFGGDCFEPALSADGSHVAFESDATDLVPNDTNGRRDIFVRDLAAGTTLRASVDSSGAEADGDSRTASISADGQRVAFESGATNLVAGDTNASFDAFVRDLAAGTTVRASVDSNGLQASGSASRNALSADGRLLVFQSAAPYLVAGDTNGCIDVFVHDLATGTTERASLAAAGGEGDMPAGEGALTPDGRCVAFTTLATNLVPNDLNGLPDVFVRRRDRAADEFCVGDGSQAACPCANSGAAGRGCENSAATGGAHLWASGATQPDTLVFSSAGELPNALSILLQGSTELQPALGFGDGLRCAGGQLKRLYARAASGGALALPGAGELSVSAQSAALGDALGPGAQRCYQIYYRDPDPGFCPAPQGGTFNATNAVRVAW